MCQKATYVDCTELAARVNARNIKQNKNMFLFLGYGACRTAVAKPALCMSRI